MSLINDALKRAKAAQDQAPPVAVPELRFRQPLPTEAAKKGSWYILILLTCGMLTLAAICFYALHKPEQPLVVNAAMPQKVEYKVSGAESAPGIAQTSTTTWDNSSDKSTPPTEPTATTRDADPAVEPTQPAQQVPPTAPTGAAEPQTPEPAVLATAPPPAPRPPEIKLQGIFWSPARPSAMINGRTVFVGDRVGQLRVLAIDQASATLAGAGQTNVLSLAD